MAQVMMNVLMKLSFYSPGQNCQWYNLKYSNEWVLLPGVQQGMG